MAIWSERANRDMNELAQTESRAAVDSIRAPISRWADTVTARQRRGFQEQLRFPVYVEAQNKEVLLVERD